MFNNDVLHRLIELANDEFNINGKSFKFKAIQSRVFVHGSIMDIIVFASEVPGIDICKVEEIMSKEKHHASVYYQYAKLVKGANLKFVEKQIINSGVADMTLEQANKIEDDILRVNKKQEIYQDKSAITIHLMELSKIKGADINSIAKYIVNSDTDYETKFIYANELLQREGCDYTIFNSLVKAYYSIPCYKKRSASNELVKLMTTLKQCDNNRLQEELDLKITAELESRRYIKKLAQDAKKRLEILEQKELNNKIRSKGFSYSTFYR